MVETITYLVMHFLQPSSHCCLIFAWFPLEQEGLTTSLLFSLGSLSVDGSRTVQSCFQKEIPVCNEVIKNLLALARKRKLH